MSQSLRKSGRLFRCNMNWNEMNKKYVSQSLRKSGRLFQIVLNHNNEVSTFYRRNPFVNQVVCFKAKA